MGLDHQISRNPNHGGRIGEFRGRKELEVARAVVRFDVRGRRARRARRLHEQRFGARVRWRCGGVSVSGDGGEDREVFFLPGETRHSIDLYHSHTRSLIPGGINGKERRKRR